MSREMPTTPEEVMTTLGITLPPPPPPVANYVNTVTSGNLVFVSGHGPFLDGKWGYIGKLDSSLTVEEGYKAARLVVLNSLASLKEEIGSLNRVRRIVKLLGMVNSDPTFQRQPEVVDGASDLLTSIFGDIGRHARSAVGMATLPFGIAVEIEMIVEVG
jgi:enamine deaminase RidA (YjgF/YER057c/UK114 family)